MEWNGSGMTSKKIFVEWNGMEVKLRNFLHHGMEWNDQELLWNGMEMEFKFSRFWTTSGHLN